MKIEVKVIPRSSQEKIVTSEQVWKIYVRASATDGKANKSVRALLAKHFSTAKTNISILRGEKARQKLIEIL